MKTDETFYGWACSDCIMLIANGETPVDMSEDETREWLDTIAARTDGMHVVPGGQHEGCANVDQETGEWIGASDCDCETVDFAWTHCESCGSGLGGSRHAVAMWQV